MTRVFKFGGALMKDAEGIARVVSIVEDYSCEPLVVVVSALGKTTNALERLLELARKGEEKNLQQEFFRLKQFHLRMAAELFEETEDSASRELEELFRELWEKLQKPYSDKYFAYDQVVGFGERFSSLLLSRYLRSRGLPAQWVDAREVIRTDSNFTDAGIRWNLTEQAVRSKVVPLLEKQQVVLSQGFVGADEEGNPTTLGREGSDFTAAIFAHVLQADEVSIWKDVPGLMNCDPNRFANAKKLSQISYHEAIELAFYGASVIHPKTIQPLQQKNIPLKVRSFFRPDSEPSLISSDTSHDADIHKVIVKDKQVLVSIASKNLSFIAEENLKEIFRVLSKHKIHINLMQNSAVSFSVCFNEDVDKLQALVEELRPDYLVRYNENLQLLTIRHYTREVIDELTRGKTMFLEQRSRATLQLLVKEG